MLFRIWLVMLALLMSAAPADVVAETAEVSSAIAADDETATAAVVVKLDEHPPRRVRLPRVAKLTRPSPALARVFRPPRPTFD